MEFSEHILATCWEKKNYKKATKMTDVAAEAVAIAAAVAQAVAMYI